MSLAFVTRTGLAAAIITIACATLFPSTSHADTIVSRNLLDPLSVTSTLSVTVNGVGGVNDSTNTPGPFDSNTTLINANGISGADFTVEVNSTNGAEISANDNTTGFGRIEFTNLNAPIKVVPGQIFDVAGLSNVLTNMTVQLYWGVGPSDFESFSFSLSSGSWFSPLSAGFRTGELTAFIYGAVFLTDTPVPGSTPGANFSIDTFQAQTIIASAIPDIQANLSFGMGLLIVGGIWVTKRKMR